MKPTFGSLFAGVGGFDLGFEAAGYECRFQVEWDTHCQQTLAHHWPDIPRWGDVSEVNGADLPPVDVITYGFPCQDLSVAGKRAGLDGNRSGLFFEAVRIITEMREATNGRYPTWAVAENVAGLLNADNGHAMGRCVDELAEAGSLVIEWCLVDAQWFGVPQRRRRVFLASCFDPATADRCPDPLFPVAPSSHRNPASSQQEREYTATTPPESTRGNSLQRVTGTLAAGAHPGSYNGQDAYSDMLIPFVKAKRAQTDSDDETWEPDRPNPTLNEFDTGDSRTTTAIVFHPHYHDGARVQGETMNTLTRRMGTGGNNVSMVAQPIAFTQNQREEVRDLGNASAALTAEAGSHQQTYIAQQIDSEQPTEVEQLPTDEVIGPLLSRASKGPNSDDVRDGHLIPIAFSHTQVDVQPSTENFPTLRVGGFGQGIAQPVAVDTYNQATSDSAFHTLRSQGEIPHLLTEPVAVDTYNADTDDETFHTLRATTQNYQPHVIAPTLTAANNPSRSPQSSEITQQIEAIHNAQPELAVRRLTPLECERLMGWPDDHTLHRADGKQNSDSTRYRMCGNGIVAPVSRWIAKHIANTLR
jgi:DNA-cytosine methyltransferase